MNRWLMVLLASLSVACGDGATSAPAPDGPRPAPTSGAEVEPGPPADRLAADVRPTRYGLTLAVDPGLERFTGVAEIDVSLPRAQRVVYLHAEGLDVTEVRVAEITETETTQGDGVEATWAMADEARQIASVTLPEPVGPGLVRLRITYGAAFDGGLEGLYRVEQADTFYAFTQMEPLAARKAFPCFDEPSFKTPFDVTLIVHEDHAAIANAREVRSTPTTGGMKRVRFATTEPLPTYLVAFAVGPFDVVEAPDIAANEVRSTPLPLRGVAVRGQGPRLAHALEHTPAILHALERYFGIAYPFDKLDLLAVPDFAAGAMENAGAITFRDSLLLLSDDPPVRQQRGFAYVTAHELAHMWFGDLVTMQWWDDLWLNEAFATWMETQTIESTFPQFEPEIAEMGVALHAMESDSLRSARQIRQPILSQHDIHNAFDAITYSKGNAVLAMFERWMTPEVFRRGVQIYLREHSGGNATASDLFEALSEAAGRDVRGPFESFIEQPGVPLVEVTPSCEGDAAQLTLRQSRYLPLGSSASADSVWQVPFCARYRAGGEVRQACTLLTEREGALALEGGCPDWVMPNAGGVGYYRWTLPTEALEALRTRGLASLEVREAMSLADSVEAGFRAGRISYADAMGALSPLARRPERALATAPMRLTQMAIERFLATDEEKARARAFAQRLYRAEARRAGWQTRRGETPEAQLLRAELLDFLALVAEDPGVRREAARRGRAYLGLGQGAELHPDAVAPDLAPLALTVAIQEGGAEVFDQALAHFRASTDSVVRGNLLRALSRVRAPELRTRVLDVTLEDGTRVNEMFSPLMGQLADPATRESAWAFVEANYDALLARMGPGYGGHLPRASAWFCSVEDAARARAFFEPRVAELQGGPRNLAATIEGIELCAARVENARESAQAFFAR